MAETKMISEKNNNSTLPPGGFCPGCDCYLPISKDNPCVKCEQTRCRVAFCYCCRDKGASLSVSETFIKDDTTQEPLPILDANFVESVLGPSESTTQVSSTSKHSEPTESVDDGSSSTAEGSVAIESDTVVAQSQRPDEPVSLHNPASEVCLRKSSSRREDEADQRIIHNGCTASDQNMSKTKCEDFLAVSAAASDANTRKDNSAEC